VSEQPGPTERDRDAPPERRIEEEAMRGPSPNDPDEAAERAGLEDPPGATRPEARDVT
jgi:hypothetical protein